MGRGHGARSHTTTLPPPGFLGEDFNRLTAFDLIANPWRLLRTRENPVGFKHPWGRNGEGKRQPHPRLTNIDRSFTAWCRNDLNRWPVSHRRTPWFLQGSWFVRSILRRSGERSIPDMSLSQVRCEPAIGTIDQPGSSAKMREISKPACVNPTRDRVMIDFELERQRKAERVLLATVEAVAELRRKWRSQDEAETIDSILACPVWTVVRSPRGSARSAPTRSWGSRRRAPGAVKKTAVFLTVR
jgi:hypothetical protein